jgi:hypothetical protein
MSRERDVRVRLLAVDVLGNFDVEGIVILWLSCGSGASDEELELRSPRPISRWVVPHGVG